MFFENSSFLASGLGIPVSEASAPPVCTVRDRQEEMWMSNWMGSLRSFLLGLTVA